MSKARIVIIGGYGAFGARLVERLSANADFELVIAGRNHAKATTFCDKLRTTAVAKLSAASLDATTCTPQKISQLNANIVVNASGPFQDQSYRVADSAISAGAHYVDLADGRSFVRDITKLNAKATHANVFVISGASTVPALSSAAVADLSNGLSELQRIEIAISPGNKFDPGVATTQSIFSYVGRPIIYRCQNRAQTVYGWQGLRRHSFPKVGRRWTSRVETPDLDLFPQRYPSLREIDVRAGLEVSLYHLGLWAASNLTRSGLISSLTFLAKPLLLVKQMLPWLGSDVGGMTVAVTGIDEDGKPIEKIWALSAKSGHGPYIPTLAAQIICERFAMGAPRSSGARPCFDEITLADFDAAMKNIDIATETQCRDFNHT